MPTLPWGDIRNNAMAFSREWQDEVRENAESQTFWNEFFQIFGLRRRTIASFEAPVRNVSGTWGRIDLFWKGVLLVEHKSAGEDLGKATSQAFDYIQSLLSEGRENETPRYVVISDFKRIAFYDLEATNGEKERLFDTKNLHENIRLFAFVAGYKTSDRVTNDDPVSLRAARSLASLRDVLDANGYTGADLERLAVRLTFCMFAEDTGIFEPNQFVLYIENHTREDGADLGAALAQLFDVLNTPHSARQKNLDADLDAFPYINGQLFAERIRVVASDRSIRQQIISACRYRWGEISPSIFGSLFQGIMTSPARRKIGAHYTTEANILKTIEPLFLDDLRNETRDALADRSTKKSARMRALQMKLSALKFLDPACGCGNFLVVTYRELRRLELELLLEMHGGKTAELEFGEISKLSLVDVHQFHGIEISEWPTRIAELALWLTDHQMNIEAGLAFGNLIQRIPLRNAPNIVHGNALRINWSDLLPAEDCDYVFGNPPFVGKKERSSEQKADHHLVWDGKPRTALLDYVTCWYRKAADYITDNSTRCAFVSTNSITQGEQVSVLWQNLIAKSDLHIQFAHRTFAWRSDAVRPASVHVVVIGFGIEKFEKPKIFDYENVNAEPQESVVENISPYLVEGKRDVFAMNRSKPLDETTPTVCYGSFALDDGNLTLTSAERDAILEVTPEMADAIRLFLGSKELIHGISRYCLWLQGASSDLIAQNSDVKKRIENVKIWRSGRDRDTTRELAKTPTRFAEVRQPNQRYLAFPTASLESRHYIPIAFLDPYAIASNQLYIIESADDCHFGILTSAMHMAWVDCVSGRIKSDYRYSARLVYNNFPWPARLDDKRRIAIRAHSSRILEIRNSYEDRTLGELYDPLAMPKDLYDEHRKLDRVVDRCYSYKGLRSTAARASFLLQIYESQTELSV